MRAICAMLVLSLPVGATLALADEADDKVNNEAEIRLVIDVPQGLETAACQASLEIEYYQKGSSAHVESTLSNDDCGASSGSYVIQVRYRDADGKLLSKDFMETWERLDSSPVTVEKDYFVADAIDIARVRSRKLNCTCAPDEPADGS
jgi:hypothetical protein